MQINFHQRAEAASASAKAAQASMARGIFLLKVRAGALALTDLCELRMALHRVVLTLVVIAKLYVNVTLQLPDNSLSKTIARFYVKSVTNEG